MSQDSPENPDSPDSPDNPGTPADPPPGDQPAAAPPSPAEPPPTPAPPSADPPAADPPAADAAGTAGVAPGSKRNLLLVAGVVVLVLGAVAFLLTRGGGSDSGSPVGTVETMYTALQEQDCDTLFEVMSEATWSEDGTATREEAIDECEISAADESGAMPEGVELDFELASEDGETAVVDVVAKFQGETVETPIVLIREDDRWKVDGDRTDAATGEVDADAGGG